MTTTLHYPIPITIDARRQCRSSTILGDTFDFEHFGGVDLTTGTVLEMSGYEQLCDPGATIRPDQGITLMLGRAISDEVILR